MSGVGRKDSLQCFHERSSGNTVQIQAKLQAIEVPSPSSSSMQRCTPRRELATYGGPQPIEVKRRESIANGPGHSCKSRRRAAGASTMGTRVTGRTTRDGRSDRQSKPWQRDNRTGGSDNMEAKPTTRPDPRYKVHTIMTEPIDKIFEDNTNLFTKPPKTPGVQGKFKNSKKFCKFHEIAGHNTHECISLRDEVERLVREGKLQHLVKGDSGTGQSADKNKSMG